MVFNLSQSGGGGSGGLNFTIIGSATQPASAAENTIWVQGDAITNYQFSVDEPANPTEGLLWISVGTSSNVAFSVSASNPIYVYPVSCRQYVSGAWVTRTAKSYLNGQWVDWVLHIYDLGDSGTFDKFAQAYGTESGESGAEPAEISYVYNGNHLHTSISNQNMGGYFQNRSGCIVTEKTFDLTGISTITFDFAITTGSGNTTINFCKFYVSTSGDSFDESRDTATANMGSTATRATLDVSGLSGEHYVGVLLKAGAGESVTTTLTLNSIIGE